MEEAEILLDISMHTKDGRKSGKSHCKHFADLSFSELYACGRKQLQQLQPPIIQTMSVFTQIGAKQLTEAVTCCRGSS